MGDRRARALFNRTFRGAAASQGSSARAIGGSNAASHTTGMPSATRAIHLSGSGGQTFGRLESNGGAVGAPVPSVLVRNDPDRPYQLVRTSAFQSDNVNPVTLRIDMLPPA